jgi:hypothetical protein
LVPALQLAFVSVSKGRSSLVSLETGDKCLRKGTSGLFCIAENSVHLVFSLRRRLVAAWANVVI